MAARPQTGPVRARIRPMKRRHLNQVLAIEGQVYPSGWSRTVFVSELLYAAERSYVVAKIGRMVVGYVGLMYTIDEGHITNIAVHPDWQRHKIGSQLLLHALDLTIERGLDAITLEARVSNLGAQALYERFGFQSVGVRPGYYADNREDAVIMWAHGLQGDAYRDRLTDIARSLDADGTV